MSLNSSSGVVEHKFWGSPKPLRRVCQTPFLAYHSCIESNPNLGFGEHFSFYSVEAKDQRKRSGAVFLDLRKAFDAVDHGRLIAKLRSCGVSGQVIGWISNYLSNRWQFVQVGEEVSEKERCCKGVPQCSKLGPLLFNFYTSDLPQAVSKSSVILYADDTCLYSSGSSFSDVVSIMFNRMSILLLPGLVRMQ